MSEYKLHNLITELLNLFGERKADEYINYVQNTMNIKYADQMDGCSIRNVVQQLAQNADNSEAFMCKYEELKEKNVDALSAFVNLLHSISQDTHAKDFLSKTAKKSDCTKVDVRKDTLKQVKHKLKEAIIKPSRINSEESPINQSKEFIECSPAISSWILKRPSMSWDFPSHSNLTIVSPIESIPSNSQENILIEDLLNIFMGLPGCYIEPLDLKDSYDAREFVVNDSVDVSLKELVRKMLPLASYYSIAQRFVEEKNRFEFGQVNNALAECFHSIIIDYTLFVTQLETEYDSGNLNLIKLWFFVQKKLYSLNILASIATTINKSNARGGKVLSLLHENITNFIGDTKAQNLCITLIEAASVPYMKILEMWIHKGIIVDPIHEFLVEDNEIIQREDMPVNYSADYWDKKYTIRRERIPIFLESISDVILRAGKYLNVIRQCGKTLNNHEVEKIAYKVDEKHYLDAIQKAYTYASKTLLTVVLTEQDLLGRLKSVKHYFLLDKGDFIVTFFTLCEKEFNKNVNDVIPARLESLLDLALRLSSANDDPYKEDLQAKLLPDNLQTQMLKILYTASKSPEHLICAKSRDELTVIESFTFGYEVRWPLSLILNKNSLACYQIIFRYLFFCKHVERMLCQIWKSNKVAKRFPLAIGMQYRKPFALRQRMLHSVQHLEYHMMVEVIEPHWCTFQQKIAKVNNVDEILVCHSDFLNSCLTDCMLTIPKLLNIINKLLLICIDFCQFMQTENVLQNIMNYQENSEHVGSFEENINKFEIDFTSTLMQLLTKINALNSTDHSRLFNLLYRLDFNKHYTYDQKLCQNNPKNNTSG